MGALAVLREAALRLLVADGSCKRRAWGLWRKFLLLSGDGSTSLLPAGPDIVETFGQTGELTKEVRLVRLYDLLNQVILAAD